MVANPIIVGVYPTIPSRFYNDQAGISFCELTEESQPDVILVHSRYVPLTEAIEHLETVAQLWPCAGLIAMRSTYSAAENIALLALADDVVVFSVERPELMARIHALHRRMHRTTADVLTFGNLSVDFRMALARLDGVPLPLTKLEWKILCCLARRAGSVTDVETLEAEAWPTGWGTQVALRVKIGHLRKKIGWAHIVTHEGRGYQLV